MPPFLVGGPFLVLIIPHASNVCVWWVHYGDMVMSYKGIMSMCMSTQEHGMFAQT